MLKTPLSTMIGGAFWTPKATILGGTSKTFDQIIQSLFANNEQGFAYDPNDLSTMFQDATGTVPVTGDGQPVGLILDKSKGLALGPELVVNGDFNINTYGWQPLAPETAISVVNGTLRQQIASGYSNGFLVSGGEISTNIGKTYLITGDITEISEGAHSAKIYIGSDVGTGNNGFVASPLNVAGSIRGIFTAKASTYYITLENFSGGDSYVCFDNVSVKEILGNHAHQTTSASRPILRQNATTGAYYLDFDGVDDFFETNSIDFTSTDKISLFAGIRKVTDLPHMVMVELSRSVNDYPNSFSLGAYIPNGEFLTLAVADTTGVSIATMRDPQFAAPKSAVLTGIADLSTLTISLKANDVLNTNSISAGGVFGKYPLFIGSRVGAGAPLHGHIYSLIGVGRLTTDAETAAIEKELAKLTGVTLSV